MGMPQGVVDVVDFVFDGYESEYNSPKDWEEAIFGNDDEEGFKDEVNGWKIVDRHQTNIGSLYPEAKLTKGDHTVYAINASEYESIGEVEAKYFSKDKESLEAFLKDMKHNASIKANQAVMQFQ